MTHPAPEPVTIERRRADSPSRDPFALERRYFEYRIRVLYNGDVSYTQWQRDLGRIRRLARQYVQPGQRVVCTWEETETC